MRPGPSTVFSSLASGPAVPLIVGVAVVTVEPLAGLLMVTVGAVVSVGGGGGGGVAPPRAPVTVLKLTPVWVLAQVRNASSSTTSTLPAVVLHVA